MSGAIISTQIEFSLQRCFRQPRAGTYRRPPLPFLPFRQSSVSRLQDVTMLHAVAAEGEQVESLEYAVEEAETHLGEKFWKNIPSNKETQKWMDDGAVDARQKLQLQSLNHISLEVHDQDLMEKFYTRVLGFIKLPRPNFPFDGVWLSGGGLFLHMIEVDPEVPHTQSHWKERYATETPEPWFIRRGFHKAFQVDDLDATEERLRYWGIEYDKFIVPGTGAAQVFFFDPEGNGVEVGSQYQTVEGILRGMSDGVCP